MNGSINIILASDHAGLALKEEVKKFLASRDFKIMDVGAYELVEGDDYPVYVTAAVMKVAQDMKGETKAVIFGKTGEGEAIVANRFPGVRAVVWYGGDNLEDTSDFEIIKLSREHNDANVLSIGAGFVEKEKAKKAVELWLKTPFSGEERHRRRIDQIDSIE
jgi:ribose 5-phosphate isomerase B